MKTIQTICIIVALLFSLSPSAQAESVQVKVLSPGQGGQVALDNKVTVHYSGYLMNGRKFDSSYDRQKPFHFITGARQVIAGWEQGVMGMQVGEKRELVIPPKLAYGSRGAGGVIPPNATLRFEIELLKIEDLGYTNIDNDQLKALQNDGVKIVDVRTPREWRQTGVIEGSLLLPYVFPNGRLNPKFVSDFKRIVGQDEPVILICRTGNRTQSASQSLSEEEGFKQVYNVRHGITHWMRKKNPTVSADLNSLNNTCSNC